MIVRNFEKPNLLDIYPFSTRNRNKLKPMEVVLSMRW